MTGAFSFFKSLSQIFFSRDNCEGDVNFFNTSTNLQLPYPIIYTINALNARSGWVWKGEYFDLPEEPHMKEILMYSHVGTLIIVHINENGDLKSIDKRMYSI